MTDDATQQRIHDALEAAKAAIIACQAAADGLDDIVRLVVRRKPDIYFFGVLPGQGAGHFWYGPHGMSMSSRDGPVERIDGVYAPTKGASRDQMEMGIARTVLVDGCTVVQWWDSSEDKRGGCSSAFVARGVFTFAEMMDAGREQHPKVLARFEKVYGRSVRSE